MFERITTHPFWHNKHTMFCLWLILAIVSAVTKVHRCNNFLIFRGVYNHLVRELPLYVPYPDEYFDLNHYGIVFGILIAPFSLLPLFPALVLWNVILALSLYFAIRYLPADGLTHTKDYLRVFMYYFCAHELLTALFMQQFNVAVAAIMIAAFLLVEKERDIWATLLIMLGAFVKIYTIVGLVFFLFSRQKLRFVVSTAIWTVILVLLPMLVASPQYVLGTYVDWISELFLKSDVNTISVAQNISVHGLLTRAFGLNVPYLPVAVTGALLFLIPLTRFAQWDAVSFRYSILANSLLFIVLFSSGSESSGYIIALAGVVLWYATAPWKRGQWAVALMVFVFIITSMSPSDLFPPSARTFIQHHALKALPCAIVYVWLVYEQLTHDYHITNSLLDQSQSAQKPS